MYLRVFKNRYDLNNNNNDDNNTNRSLYAYEIICWMIYKHSGRNKRKNLLFEIENYNNFYTNDR